MSTIPAGHQPPGLVRCSLNLSQEQVNIIGDHVMHGLRNRVLNPLINLLVLVLETKQLKHEYLSHCLNKHPQPERTLEILNKLQLPKEANDVD